MHQTLNLSNIDPSPVEELLKLSLNKLEFDPSEHTENWVISSDYIF